MKAKEKPHYVSNKQFSQAVVEYCTDVRAAKENDQPVPVVPDYIASCFLKIAEGLSHKANFVRYTYREEMVMDAVENMLKAIENYNIEAATRSGNPNAFAYFTQISWFSFLRRIEKEKKQQNIKLKWMSEVNIEELLGHVEAGDAEDMSSRFIDVLRERIDVVRAADTEFKAYEKEEKQRRRRAVNVDSDLSEWIED